MKSGGNLPEAVLNMSKSIDADIIVITISADSDFKQFFIGPFEQHIVNHAVVPVLSIKPKLRSPDLQIAIQHINESFPSRMPAFV
jgi:hypothetical protein